MAMTTGAGGGLSSEINVTPMIDVLLVLLIIFMIVQMLSRTILEIVIPPIETATLNPSSVSTQIVLELRDDGSNWINGQGPFPIANLDQAIHEFFDARPTKLLFLKPGMARKYADVIEAVDVSKGAGIQVFGFTPIEAYSR